MSAAHLVLALGVTAVVLATLHLHAAIAHALSPATAADDVGRLLLVHAELPRLAIALLCGAGLSASGALLQQVLRNPLASPDTVGVGAGARLALVLAGLLAPQLSTAGRDLAAIAGAALTTTLVLLIARRHRFAPLALILSGLIVSLCCGAIAAIFMLLKDRYLVALFIWGSGSLSQQSWLPALGLLLRLGLCVLPVLLLVRPLSLLDAGDDTARSLGVPVERLRVLAVGVAVLAAAFVTSTVGTIGFIGLAGPMVARLCGVRGAGPTCLWSAAIGALLLLVTDLLVQMAARSIGTFLPTGAVTALVGAPLLLALLRRMPDGARALPAARASRHAARARSFHRLRPLACALALIAAPVLLVLVGRGPGGEWLVLGARDLAVVLPWRLPRLLATAGAGGLLAVAGLVLQRVTGNPLASPEITGVSAGAVLGAAAALLFTSVGTLGLTLAATIGAAAALLLVVALAAGAAFSPDRMLLAGVALTALVDALVGVLMATGDAQAVQLMAWLAGSAGGIGLPVALGVAASLPLLTAIAVLAARWLVILPLGAAPATAIGVPVGGARASLLLFVALATAIATPVVGPLSFVGLVAPHAVGLFGIRHVPAALLASAAAGAAFMMLADTLARMVAFPVQLPSGVLASVLAAPVLLLLMASADASGHEVPRGYRRDR